MNKKDFTEFKLIFNYHFVYENSLTSIMKLTQRVHNNLEVINHRTYFSTNMKHEY